MAARRKKPGLLKYGYWNYQDPVPAIRKLLAKKEELLEEFEAMYGDFVPYEGLGNCAPLTCRLRVATITTQSSRANGGVSSAIQRRPT